MAKSMRCKREKRLRAIKREIVEPFYDKKDAAKLAAQEAALAAPKLPVRYPSTSAMEITENDATTSTTTANMELEMTEGSKGSLKPVGGVGKKLKKKFKLGRNKRLAKGKFKGKISKRKI
ncbi:hypothetical protein HS088_TW21G01400 [Tripterygium wilfordii]|uniref:Uncharacterized protein n=1 Tax=Tripterygium wilfordii TaxID=458696 RepID=A0A7J7C501_TRIWF|nr:uncharacterized protein LOC119988185 [Tripterygium wilfordii]KAF5729240.1 hypothetical protein HS088_TW21G01400 [Tripterygium wilfordii]